MRPFTFARTDDLGQALAAASDPGTSVLAGGTELLNWIRIGIASPERLLDISRIPGLGRIELLEHGGLRIGAGSSLSAAAADPRVVAQWPVLSEAVLKSASPQIRNRATLGGNLLQKTRCAYFRSERAFPCNRRDPGSGCAALDGRNDRHAIFGWTETCIATQPSDPAVALAALDAVVITFGPDGARRLPVRNFHNLPDTAVEHDTLLGPGELMVALELPRPAPLSAYLKVRERESYEYALVSAAATVQLDDQRSITGVTLALGSVAMRPWRLDAAEAAIVGLPIDSPEIGRALDSALTGARPLEHNGFKVALARNTALRAVHMAAESGQLREMA